MLGFLGDLLGLNAGNATKDAAGQNKSLIKKYDAQGNAIIDQGSAEAGGYLQQVAGLYDNQIDRATQGTALYDDALGLNGAEGSGRATSAFQTNPGYEFQRDQGLQALDRRASSAGSFRSGNADIDTMTYATGLADQSYGDWLTRLGGYENTMNTALAGKTGGLNNLANLATGTAGQKLGLAGEVTSNLMGSNNQYAEGEEANKKGIAGLGGNLLGMAGRAFGFGGF